MQYLAITSTLLSCCEVACCSQVCNEVSKFFDGGNVTSSTQSSCQPLNTLSLTSQIRQSVAMTFDVRKDTYLLGFPLSCFIT